MLRYEVELHAKAIHARLIATWFTNNGVEIPPSLSLEYATAALRMAETFSAVVDQQEVADSERTSGREVPTAITFAHLVEQWRRDVLSSWAKAQRNRVLNRFRRYLLPHFGDTQAGAVSSLQLIAALRAVEDAGFLPLAHLILKEVARLYRYAIAAGHVRENPALGARGSLYRRRPKHRATILLPNRIGELLRAIDTYHGYTTSKYMLRLMPLLFVRPGELRNAEWSEIDFKGSEWRIPAQRMKAHRLHIVPLSRQAKAILRQVHRITGKRRYVFASDKSESGVISEHLCTTMLQSIGFRGEMTMSGFRSMAATHLNEQGWSSDAIERQLSHADPRPIRRIYNFAMYLPERRKMMQAWADYLDKLRRGSAGASRL